VSGSPRSTEIGREPPGQSREPIHGIATDAPVATDAAPTAVAHPTGPSGVQPKNWLTGGSWMMGTSRPADASADAITAGLRLPVTIV
jgi:hypothetical protein